jgi:hypothetical protein
LHNHAVTHCLDGSAPCHPGSPVISSLGSAAMVIPRTLATASAAHAIATKSARVHLQTCACVSHAQSTVLYDDLKFTPSNLFTSVGACRVALAQGCLGHSRSRISDSGKLGTWRLRQILWSIIVRGGCVTVPGGRRGATADRSGDKPKLQLNAVVQDPA